MTISSSDARLNENITLSSDDARLNENLTIGTGCVQHGCMAVICI